MGKKEGVHRGEFDGTKNDWNMAGKKKRALIRCGARRDNANPFTDG